MKAPEIFQGKIYGKEADIYSLGIVFWEILTQNRLYPQFASLFDVLLFYYLTNKNV